MSLGTGAIQGWWRPCPNTRHSREVPWQPCEQEPALKAATNQHHPTEGTSVEKLAWPDTYHEPLPMRGGKGWVQNWQNRRPKQWSTKLNWWPKQWSVQGSDLQRSVQQATAILATIAQMQAHGEASPCGHPTDPGDRWTHWLEINLAYITFSHISLMFDIDTKASGYNWTKIFMVKAFYLTSEVPSWYQYKPTRRHLIPFLSICAWF